MGGRNGQQGRVIQQTAPHQGAAHLPRPRALGPTPPAWPATATFVAVRLSGSPAAHGALSSGKKPPRLPPSITAPGRACLVGVMAKGIPDARCAGARRRARRDGAQRPVTAARHGNPCCRRPVVRDRVEPREASV
jgi:hypothetical protein